MHAYKHALIPHACEWDCRAICYYPSCGTQPHLSDMACVEVILIKHTQLCELWHNSGPNILIGKHSNTLKPLSLLHCRRLLRNPSICSGRKSRHALQPRLATLNLVTCPQCVGCPCEQQPKQLAPSTGQTVSQPQLVGS